MARKVYLRCLEYDVSLVPEGGMQVVCKVAGPIATGSKDAAGFYFHLAQLKQAGLWGELQHLTFALNFHDICSCAAVKLISMQRW